MTKGLNPLPFDSFLPTWSLLALMDLLISRSSLCEQISPFIPFLSNICQSVLGITTLYATYLTASLTQKCDNRGTINVIVNLEQGDRCFVTHGDQRFVWENRGCSTRIDSHESVARDFEEREGRCQEACHGRLQKYGRNT